MVGKYVSIHRRQVTVGGTYGRLKVFKFAGRNKHGNLTYDCACTCGTKKVVTGSNILGGTFPSCGCFKRDQIIKRNKEELPSLGNTAALKHGLHGTVEYSTWLGILARCYRKSNRLYPSYGGRGITVCNRWRHSVENFVADMGERPEGRFSIERIDNSKGYSPANCKWATCKEQNRNRRNVRKYEYQGERRTLPDLAEQHKLAIGTIEARLRRGWGLEKALTSRLKYNAKP